MYQHVRNVVLEKLRSAEAPPLWIAKHVQLASTEVHAIHVHYVVQEKRPTVEVSPKQTVNLVRLANMCQKMEAAYIAPWDTLP